MSPLRNTWPSTAPPADQPGIPGTAPPAKQMGRYVGRLIGIAAIVAEKIPQALPAVRRAVAAIQGSSRISEMLSDIPGIEDFEAVPSLEPFVFSRVFVLAFAGSRN